MGSRFGVIVRSAVVAAAAYFAAVGVERAFTRLVAASTGELLWISDLVLAVVVGIVSYLWINLRASRFAVSRLEREQIVLNTQLAVAADIQRRVLPPLPAPQGGVEWAARLEPAGKIGGDFYDFVQDDGVVLVLVGDISGKGIPAALLLALGRAVFRMSVRETRDPGEIVERLSRALYDDTQGSPYATCMVLAIDLNRRTITYANAGHPAGLLIGPSGRRELEPSGPPAGMFPSWSFPSSVVPLQPGDVGVVVTDGVTEALEGDESRTPQTTIEEMVRRLDTAASAEATCGAIMEMALRGHGPKGVEGWQDDRTVVVFKVAP